MPPVVAGGVAAGAAQAKAPNVQSSKKRFIVDWWFSYDITGLSAGSNAAPTKRLTLKDQNNPDIAVDLVVGRRLVLQPTITASGVESRETAADYVFQRVKPAPKLYILDLADLCQPLWAIPFLHNVATAKAFFAADDSKWSADQWLVVKKLY